VDTSPEAVVSWVAWSLHHPQRSCFGPIPSPPTILPIACRQDSPHSLMGSSDQSRQSLTELQTLSMVMHSPLWHLNLLGPSQSVTAKSPRERSGVSEPSELAWSFTDMRIDVRPGVPAHACNPSYSGSRGRKIESSRPAQTKLARSYLEGWRSGSSCKSACLASMRP
jgi:hypothetical protein